MHMGCSGGNIRLLPKLFIFLSIFALRCSDGNIIQPGSFPSYSKEDRPISE